MAKYKYLLISSVLIILSVFLMNHFGIFGQTDQTEQVDPEPEVEEEIVASDEEDSDPDNDTEGQDYITGDTLRPAGNQKTDPAFNYESDIKVNGVVEENLGEEWWVFD